MSRAAARASSLCSEPSYADADRGHPRRLLGVASRRDGDGAGSAVHARAGVVADQDPPGVAAPAGADHQQVNILGLDQLVQRARHVAMVHVRGRDPATRAHELDGQGRGIASTRPLVVPDQNPAEHHTRLLEDRCFVPQTVGPPGPAGVRTPRGSLCGFLPRLWGDRFAACCSISRWISSK